MGMKVHLACTSRFCTTFFAAKQGSSGAYPSLADSVEQV
jgi:hypothetical protein